MNVFAKTMRASSGLCIKMGIDKKKKNRTKKKVDDT